MKYYLGGYYLTMLRPLTYGSAKGIVVYTASECINDNLVDEWTYSWAVKGGKRLKKAKQKLGFSDTQMNSIRNWADKKYIDRKLGWMNVFTDLETALEYKSKFFSHLADVQMLALYFDETGREGMLEELKTETDVGLRITLLKEIDENVNEMLLGYDYIGIEVGGSFHTFHCHDIGKELCDKFDLTLNEFGLFDSNKNSRQVLDYLNDEGNGCEPVPWFIAKIKRVSG